MRRVGALLVLVLTMLSCGPASSSGAGGVSGEAPFGTVDAVGGGQIDGAPLAGQDLALWFWAPW